MPRTRVLLVADEYYASLAAVRGLRAGGYDPWVGTTTADGYAQRSRAAGGVVRLPAPSEGESFVRAVAAAAASLGAACVLPASEDALAALAGRADALPGTRLGAPEPEALARATDKRLLAVLAAEAGLATPPQAELDASSADDAFAGLSFPAVAKPTRTAVLTGTGASVTPPVARVEDRAALRAQLAAHPGVRWVVQPFVAGRLLAVAGVARSGETLCAVHQQARRIFPPSCGVSAFAETVPRDEGLEERLRALVRLIGVTGIWQAQLLADADDVYLIDVNPRVYGSLALAIAAGANLPAIWADVLLERTPRVGDYRVGVRYRAEMRELGALAHAVGARDLGAVARLLAPRRHTTHAVLSLRDPAPSLLLGRRILARSRG